MKHRPSLLGLLGAVTCIGGCSIVFGSGDYTGGGSDGGDDASEDAAGDAEAPDHIVPSHLVDRDVVIAAAEATVPEFLTGYAYLLNTDTKQIVRCAWGGPEDPLPSECAEDATAYPLAIESQQEGDLQVAVFAVKAFTIPEGAVLVVGGTHPLVIVSAGDITIDGVIYAGVTGGPGPGGTFGMETRDGGGLLIAPAYACQSDGGGGDPATSLLPALRVAGQGECGRFTTGAGAGGGGGGGHAGLGGLGGTGSPDAPPSSGGGGGAVQNIVSSVGTLAGGAGGGAGGFATLFTRRPRGGHGGGAVQLTSDGKITIGAMGGVLAPGGPGEAGGLTEAPTEITGGGGGGAGGTVFLEAREIEIAGFVSVNGGGGGGGDAATDERRASPGGPAKPTEAATGGAGVDDDGFPPDGEGGAGGDGSFGTKLQGRPGEGKTNLNSVRAGGGGGGAAGRIFLRAGDVTYVDGSVVSPSPTSSAVSVESPEFFSP
jgi:hypothetical protein